MIGVDAILIQDLGVLSLASSLFSGKPGTPALHASTQMAVHNQEGALYALEKGCTRIVLARELPAREVRDIAESLKQLGAEVEIFGHGALCYAYSGQCLLSAVIGGRSGNRGMCAQPCRKPYALIKGERDRYGRLTKPRSVNSPDQFLLSTRDLSVYPVLTSVASLPIAALKIEGRMRTPSYVATVVSIYRRALDAVMSGSFSPSSEEETELTLAFSRGFTTGYLNEETCQTVMGRDLPGRRGLVVGTVTGITREGWMSIKRAGDLIPERGDGLVCISNSGEQGFVLRRDSVVKKGEVLLDSKITSHRGDQVYLTSRGRNIRLLEQLTSDPDTRYYGSIALSLELNISPAGEVDITGTIRTRIKGTIPFSFRSQSQFSPARSRPLTSDQINDALRKTGGTLFTIDHLATSCPDGLFAPVAVLNGIRREILEFAQSCIIKSYLPEPELIQEIKDCAQSCIEQLHVDPGVRRSNNGKSDLSLVILVSDPASALSGVQAGASRAYIEWYPACLSSDSSDHLDEILALFAVCPSRADVIGIKLPKILLRTEMDRLTQALPEIKKAGVKFLMVDGIGVSQAVLTIVPELQVSGYSGLNITNHCSLEVHSQLEFCTLSCELSGDEIRVLIEKRTNHSPPVGIIVQGLLETIITEDQLCVSHHIPEPNIAYAIRDQKEQIFPIVLDPSHRTHIFNSAETSLIDHVNTLKEAGEIIGIIDARWRGPDYAHEMVAIWSDAINKPNLKQGELDSIKDAIRNCAWGVLTSATWKRGICRSDS